VILAFIVWAAPWCLYHAPKVRIIFTCIDMHILLLLDANVYLCFEASHAYERSRFHTWRSLASKKIKLREFHVLVLAIYV
jgi:hypothetical protein